MAKKSLSNLAVVSPSPADDVPSPPPDLDAVGEELWREVTATYTFDDPGSWEVLYQACMARSRAARCAAVIERDGELIRSEAGVRDNPLIKHEIAARALCIRLLARLGMNLAPVRDRPGRPPGFA